MKITQIKIGLHNFNDSKIKKIIDEFKDRYLPISFVRDENNYFAEVIEKDGKYFYRVDGTTVGISEYEYKNVIHNNWGAEAPLLIYCEPTLFPAAGIKSGDHAPFGKLAYCDIEA